MLFRFIALTLLISTCGPIASAQTPATIFPKISMGPNREVLVDLSDGRQVGLYLTLLPTNTNLIHPFRISDNSCSDYYDGVLENQTPLKMGCRIVLPQVMFAMVTRWTKNSNQLKVNEPVLLADSKQPLFMPLEKDGHMDAVKMSTIFDDVIRDKSKADDPVGKLLTDLARYAMVSIGPRLVCDDYRWISGGTKSTPQEFRAPRWSQEASFANSETDVNEKRFGYDVTGLKFRQNKKREGLDFTFNRFSGRQIHEGDVSTSKFIPAQGDGLKSQMTILKNPNEVCFVTIESDKDKGYFFEKSTQDLTGVPMGLFSVPAGEKMTSPPGDFSPLFDALAKPENLL